MSPVAVKMTLHSCLKLWRTTITHNQKKNSFRLYISGDPLPDSNLSDLLGQIGRYSQIGMNKKKLGLSQTFQTVGTYVDVHSRMFRMLLLRSP